MDHILACTTVGYVLHVLMICLAFYLTWAGRVYNYFFREVSAPTIPNSCAVIESAMNNRDKTPQYIESKQIPVPVDINFYYKKIWINIQKVAGIVNSKATWI